jgi:2,3-diketo-5-methylthio-1-phosphopentane phosphatase
MINKSADMVIFCDFDGTITQEDCIDKLLNIYADKEWENIEREWKNGLIGSKECIVRQLKCVEKISFEQLEDFIKNIKIDNHFFEFINYIQKNSIEFHIVSDGFGLFIKNILGNNNIFNISAYSNDLELLDSKLIASFPNSKENCLSQGGNCKCGIIKKLCSNKFKIYIGDGKSDICAIKNADLIFAKGTLAKYCVENSINFVEYDNFNKILNHIAQKEREADGCGIN